MYACRRVMQFQSALAYIFQKYASVPAPPGSNRRIASSSSARNVSGGLSSSIIGDGDDQTVAADDSTAEAEAAARGREQEEEERVELRSSFGPSSSSGTGTGVGAGASTPASSSSLTAPSEGGPRRPTQPAPTSSSRSHPSSSASTQLQPASSSSSSLPVLGSSPAEGAVLSDAALDRFAFETNGAPFGAESKAEILEFLDVDEQGRLTFEGFLSMYSLQTENDEDETWRDLTTHGFDNNLELVSTRREDTGVDEGRPVPKKHLLGDGQGGPVDENRPVTPSATR
ncbi:hypothetical protein OC845_003134 [Tilletia horrida]|nr:hypothetical protein OC845_003134 [Tilletia horrida]